MGMYTELVMAVELTDNTPEYVIDILRYMVRDVEERPNVLPDHPLFKTDRWDIMLVCDSCYFPGETHSTLKKKYGSEYYLAVRSNLKNYDWEIELFLDWITDYIYAFDEFIGYYMHEEDNLPTLIIRDYKCIRLMRVYDNESTNMVRLVDRLYTYCDEYRTWYNKLHKKEEK